MRFTQPTCPECGGDPVSFVETTCRWEHITKGDEADSMEYDYLGDHTEGDDGDSYCIEECKDRLAEAVLTLVRSNFHHDHWAAVERLVEELEGHKECDCVTLVCETQHQWHTQLIRPTEAKFCAPTAEDTP